MKRMFIILLSVISITFCSCEKAISLDELLKENFGFTVWQKENNNNYLTFAYIYNRDGNFKAVYSDTYSNILSIKQSDACIELIIEGTDKIIRGEWPFWDWNYPMKVKLILTSKNIKKIIKIYENGRLYDYFVNESSFTPSTCNALIITDNLRIRSEPNLGASTKIIGKLNKWDDVHLIDCTKEKTKIDNLEYPWYKVQLENGQEGWIFGGFAKIYFFEDDKNDIRRAFEKEGSEYTNQFETPEGFY